MIRVNLDVIMAKRKINLTELAKKVDISLANLSILKNNKGKAIRFSTLDALCRALACQPSDILEFVEEEDHHGQPSYDSVRTSPRAGRNGENEAKRRSQTLL